MPGFIGRKVLAPLLLLGSPGACVLPLNSSLSLRVSLLQLCPELVFCKPNFAKYTAAAEKVRAIIAVFDPDYESASLDEAYMDITSYCQLHSTTGASVEHACVWYAVCASRAHDAAMSTAKVSCSGIAHPG